MKKMKSLLCVYLILVFLFCTTACSQITYSQEHTDDVSPFIGYFSSLDSTRPLAIEDMFLGILPETSAFLPQIACEVDDSQCLYQGNVYDEVAHPEGYSYPEYCFWQLDCDYLEVLGEFSSEYIVYGIMEEERVVSLLFVRADTAQPDVRWFVLHELDLLDPCDYQLSDFNVEIISGERDSESFLKKVWNFHTLAQYSDTRDLIYEASVGWRTIFLVNQKHPWMIYELNYSYVHGEIYIYNVPNDGTVLLNSNGYSVLK